MGNKAPDTRNRIDNQSNINSKKKIKKANSLQKITIKKLKDVIEESIPSLNTGVIRLKLDKKPSKGSVFKKEHGYSKTMKRLLNKHDLTPAMIDNYREIRRERKRKKAKTRQRKHEDNRLYRSVHIRVKGKNKQQQPSKKKKGK